MDSRQRSRRPAIVAAMIACATLGPPAVAFAASKAPAAPASHAKAASTPRCRSSDIVVWLGLNPDGAAAGTTFYPLEFSNAKVGSRTCWIAGSPGVFAINGANKRIGPAIKASTSGRRITLKPGQTAFARLGIVDAGVIANCGQTTGAGLEVTPPGQSVSQPIFSFTFPVCKRKRFMHVMNLQAGVGIP